MVIEARKDGLFCMRSPWNPFLDPLGAGVPRPSKGVARSVCLGQDPHSCAHAADAGAALGLCGSGRRTALPNSENPRSPRIRVVFAVCLICRMQRADAAPQAYSPKPCRETLQPGSLVQTEPRAHHLIQNFLPHPYLLTRQCCGHACGGICALGRKKKLGMVMHGPLFSRMD